MPKNTLLYNLCNCTQDQSSLPSLRNTWISKDTVALWELNKINLVLNIFSGYFTVIYLLLWPLLGLTPLSNLPDIFADGDLLFFSLQIHPLRMLNDFLEEKLANKSVTSSIVTQEWLTHLGLSWLAHNSTSSHSATQSSKWSPGKLLWFITTLQLKSISHSHHVDKKKNSVIRNGSALSRLELYKLQSDYVDKIHELNLSVVTTLVTALFNAS